MKSVFVVIDSRGSLVGVYAAFGDATDACDSHPYFCRILKEEVK